MIGGDWGNNYYADMTEVFDLDDPTAKCKVVEFFPAHTGKQFMRLPNQHDNNVIDLHIHMDQRAPLEHFCMEATCLLVVDS